MVIDALSCLHLVVIVGSDVAEETVDVELEGIGLLGLLEEGVQFLCSDHHHEGGLFGGGRVVHSGVAGGGEAKHLVGA